MGYVALVVIILIGAVTSYFKFKSNSLKERAADLHSNDIELQKKIEASKAKVEEARKELSETKAENLSPTQVEDFWSKK